MKLNHLNVMECSGGSYGSAATFISPASREKLPGQVDEVVGNAEKQPPSSLSLSPKPLD